MQFPPIYSFPPLYTRQPNQITRNKQIDTWSQLIITTAQSLSAWEIDQKGKFKVSNDKDKGNLHKSSIFHNEEINRSVSQMFIDEILSSMLSKAQLLVKDVDPKRKIQIVSSNNNDSGNTELQFFVLWKSLDAWGSMLLEWFETCGKLSQVVTLYELSMGDESIGWEFHGMPSGLLVECLKVLVRRGRATLIRDEDAGDRYIAVKVV